jgi:uncharacterized protein (TIGR03083 family)
MDSASLLAALAADGAALADAADGHLDSRVRTCPDWTVADLVTHLGTVHRWVSATVAAGGEPVGFRDVTGAPDDRDALVGWYRDGLAELIPALSVDPETPAWTFSGAAPSNVGWWQRRQALETAVHRFDSQTAALGRPDPIGAELAVIGIDELIAQFLPGILESRAEIEELKGTFHLHATDIPGEWWLDFDAPGLAARREHAKADTAVRGPASGLYLWMWNRQSPEDAGLEVFGRAETVAAWRSVTI